MINVYSTREKVYIEGLKGCIARLCILSAEFYIDPEHIDLFENCSFEKFQEEAKRRGFAVEEKHRPQWA
jgi:hypothetical protein